MPRPERSFPAGTIDPCGRDAAQGRGARWLATPTPGFASGSRLLDHASRAMAVPASTDLRQAAV